MLNAVDVVAAEARNLRTVLFQHGEVIAIVGVQAVTGGYPDEAIRVLEHLCGEVARKLVVCVE